MSQARTRTHVTFLTLAILAGIFLLWSQSRIGMSIQSRRPKPSIEQEERAFQANPDLFRVATFGQSPTAVDLLLLGFLSDERMTHVTEQKRASVYYLRDLATT